MATTEYEVVSTVPASISQEEGKSITVARTSVGATGKLVEALADFGAAWFYFDDERAVQILAAIDTGDISGIPIEIERPSWADTIRCAIDGENCE